MKAEEMLNEIVKHINEKDIESRGTLFQATILYLSNNVKISRANKIGNLELVKRRL